MGMPQGMDPVPDHALEGQGVTQSVGAGASAAQCIRLRPGEEVQVTIQLSFAAVPHR